ncbi:MAG TPA: hypothetical protein V6C76_01185 [Drouetiella sp.]
MKLFYAIVFIPIVELISVAFFPELVLAATDCTQKSRAQFEEECIPSNELTKARVREGESKPTPNTMRTFNEQLANKPAAGTEKSVQAQKFPPHQPSRGFLVGLTDLQGHQILAPRFNNVTYMGNGLYIAEATNYSKMPRMLIFTESGRKLPYKIPNEAILYKICSLGKNLDENQNIAVQQIPRHSLLEFQNIKSGEIGICHPDGTVLLPPQQGVPCILDNGAIYIQNEFFASKPNEILDTKTGELKVTTDKLLAFSPKERRWAGDYTSKFKDKIAQQTLVEKESDSWLFEQISDRRMRKVVDKDDGYFNSTCWKKGWPIARSVMFERLLREYDLIGMSSDQFAQLVGLMGNPSFGDGVLWANYKGDIKSYVTSFGGGGCVPQMNLHVRFEFTNDKLTSWCFLNGVIGPNPTESPAITTNVLIPSWYEKPHARLHAPRYLRLVNARIDGSARENWYPIVVQKSVSGAKNKSAE